MNIQGKNALITGGASGLGAACARMIHSAGGRPVIIDLNAEAGEALAVELGGVFARADVSNAP
jgi:NAD(P)-dependent dehydrogenase (short-subunit alcohol dehydrogenase family)